MRRCNGDSAPVRTAPPASTEPRRPGPGLSLPERDSRSHPEIPGRLTAARKLQLPRCWATAGTFSGSAAARIRSRTRIDEARRCGDVAPSFASPRVIRAMNPGLVRRERWPLLPVQGQPEATGTVARTLLHHRQVPGACQLDPPTRPRVPEPRNVPAPAAVAMPLLLDVAPDLAVAGKRLSPSAARSNDRSVTTSAPRVMITVCLRSIQCAASRASAMPTAAAT